MSILSSNSDVCQVVSTETVVDRARVAKEGNDEKKRLGLFENKIYAFSYYSFLRNRLVSGNNYVKEGRFMQLSLLDAWVATGLTRSEKRRTSDSIN